MCVQWILADSSIKIILLIQDILVTHMHTNTRTRAKTWLPAFAFWQQAIKMSLLSRKRVSGAEGLTSDAHQRLHYVWAEGDLDYWVHSSSQGPTAPNTLRDLRKKYTHHCNNTHLFIKSVQKYLSRLYREVGPVAKSSEVSHLTI